MNLPNEQLNQLAIAAQRHPRCSFEQQTALRQLVNGILRSGQVGYPQRGFFPGRYEEIHDEAVQDLLLYICQNIHKYDPERGSVMAWVNMLLERRFFREAIPKVIGQSNAKWVTLDSIGDIAAPEATPTLAELLKEIIEADPDGLFKREHLEGCPSVNFQVLLLRRQEGRSWLEIASEFGVKTGSISSFYSRCLKKYSKKLQAYCVYRGN